MTFICPTCGEEVPDKARACPHCGSDDRTGWSDSIYLDGVDLGDDFDYEETLRREGLLPQKPDKDKWMFTLIILLLILAFLLHFVFRWI